MVSARTLVQAVMVIAGAVVASAAPSPDVKTLKTVPYMPRIPSAAKHTEVLRARSLEADPTALVDVQCLDDSQTVRSHDEAVAQLSICGGLSGSATECRGYPVVTHGESRSARFTLHAVELEQGATINISKESWNRCVQAARAQCPTGSLSATCAGGASSGDVGFILENPLSMEL